MMARCLSHLIEPYALGPLTGPAADALERHLDECDYCGGKASALAETVAGLAVALPSAEPPAALRSRIMDAIRSEGH
jgi:hypothetical protein